MSKGDWVLNKEALKSLVVAGRATEDRVTQLDGPRSLRRDQNNRKVKKGSRQVSSRLTWFKERPEMKHVSLSMLRRRGGKEDQRSPTWSFTRLIPRSLVDQVTSKGSSTSMMRTSEARSWTTYVCLYGIALI